MTTKTTTTRARYAYGLAALVTSAVGLPHAVAQPTGELNVDVSECLELTTPEDRLECFEARAEAARRERSGAEREPRRRAEAEPRSREPEPSVRAPAPEPAPPRAPEPRTVAAEPTTEAPRAADRLSRAERRRAEREARGPRSGDPDAPEVVARIVETRETVPNAFVITLDNGQVWRQTVPAPYPLRKGSEVRLYPTRWGDSYRMTAAEYNGYIQVERVR